MSGSTLRSSGSPGRRDWLANIAVHPELTLHLKRSVQADLPARGRPVVEREERRRVLTEIVAGLGGARDLDAWVARSPLVELALAP